MGCGTADLYDPTVPTQSNPVVSRVSPVAATAGDTVTIFGFGFSVVPQNNVIIIGDGEAIASTYGLVNPPIANEIEFLMFVVPAGLTLGANSIYVDVLDVISNTNITLTIN